MSENSLKKKLTESMGSRRGQKALTRAVIEHLGFPNPPPIGWQKLAKGRLAGISDASDRMWLESILKSDQFRTAKLKRRQVKSKRRRQRKLDNEHKDPKGQLKGYWNPDRAGKNKTQKLDNKHFYDSWQWAEVRFQTLKKYGAKCMFCGSKKNPQVDHIKPRSLYPKLALDPNNLQVLCALCNKGKSNKDTSDFRPNQPDECKD